MTQLKLLHELVYQLCRRVEWLQLHIPPKLLVHVLARPHILQQLHDRFEADLAGREREQRVPIALCLDVLVRVQHHREGRELRDVVDRDDRPELLLHPDGHVVHLTLQEHRRALLRGQHGRMKEAKGRVDGGV